MVTRNVKNRKQVLVLAAVVAVGCLAPATKTSAAVRYYTLDGTGNWSDIANWSTSSGGTGGATAPNAAGDSALYSRDASRTVTVNTDVIAGIVENTNRQRWTIGAGAGTLTMNGTGLTNNLAKINQSSGRGSITVNEDVIMASDLLITHVTSDTSPDVTVNGSISGAGALTLQMVQNSSSGTGTTKVIVTGGVNHTGSLVLESGSGGTRIAQVTVSGAIGSNVTSITKTGNNAAFLSGATANTFAGLTTVNDGILNLSKSANVQALGGSLTVGDGTGADRVELNNSNQIADTATLTLNTTGIFDLNTNVEILNSLLAFTGADLTGGSGAILTVNSASFNGITLAPGTYSDALANDPGFISGTAQLVVVVPEPTSSALVGMGVIGALAGRRRRKN